MTVLIVEDSQEKASHLREAVAEAGIDQALVSTIPDVSIAKQRLRDGVDVLILDLQIPMRYGDTASRDGGVKLLKWIDRYLDNPPQHIIAVTSFPVEDNVRDSLNNFGVPVVVYSPSASAWKHFVIGLVRRVLPGSQTTDEKAFAVVITAVEIETEQVKRVFSVSGVGERKLGVYWHRAVVNGKTVIIAQASQMGMPATAVLVSKAIRLWKPHIVISTGICAGIKGEVEMGDVIIPNPCWDYGSGKSTDELLKPDPRPIQLSEQIRAIVEIGQSNKILEERYKEWPAEKPRSLPEVYIMPSVSGSAVISDSKTVPDIQRQSRKVVGLDMENYGLYYACANSGQEPALMFCSIKAVVDFADSDKSDKFQSYGAYISACFGLWVIDEIVI